MIAEDLFIHCISELIDNCAFRAYQSEIVHSENTRMQKLNIKHSIDNKSSIKTTRRIESCGAAVGMGPSCSAAAPSMWWGWAASAVQSA